MSTPPFDQIPPPLLPATERQDYTYHHRHGSVGPAIGALAVIMVLGVIAVMIGRICSGRKILNQRQYDFDGWVETKFSSCIDGRVSPPPPPCVAAMESCGEGAIAGGGGEPVQEEMGHH